MDPDLRRRYAEMDRMGEKDPALTFLGSVGSVSVRVNARMAVPVVELLNSDSPAGSVIATFTEGEAKALSALLRVES